VALGGLWDASSGYHNLRQTLQVNYTATNSLPQGGEIPVLSYSAVAETYASWQMRNFPGNPTAGAPLADPDGDGRPNLVEFAVGSDPNTPQTTNYMQLLSATNSLLVSVAKGPGAANVVAYAVEVTPALTPANWSTNGVTVVEDSAAWFRARYDTTNSSGFLRLRFSLIQ